MVRTIIIDDEPSAINVLSIFLKKKFKDDVEVIATSTSAAEGKELIEKLRPDLVFLDIEMPGISGIDLVRSCTNTDFRLVFVTAYDTYAVEAFELSALDYLLKPVSAEKLYRVMEKIKAEPGNSRDRLNAQLQKLEKILKLQSAGHEKISISTADKIIFINISEIIYCEASGAYAHVHLCSGKNIFTSRTLGDFESQLSSENFFRIHNSFLINLNRIKEFQRNEGSYVLMENNIKLAVSQRRRKDFLDAIEKFVL
ncbi:MAG TPA: LytTR family DNA-binding domain-containing protein [Parafilimonas sp.]|nr:LytTR family DNA-binding domain-containing protein [Parafilimonas sp.]